MVSLAERFPPWRCAQCQRCPCRAAPSAGAAPTGHPAWPAPGPGDCGPAEWPFDAAVAPPPWPCSAGRCSSASRVARAEAAPYGGARPWRPSQPCQPSQPSPRLLLGLPGYAFWRQMAAAVVAGSLWPARFASASAPAPDELPPGICSWPWAFLSPLPVPAGGWTGDGVGDDGAGGGWA